jgi:outer membrane protein
LRTPLLAAALLAALPAAAGALEPDLGLRVGVGAAAGSAARNVPMSEVVPVQYPVQLDLLAREGPLAAGAYGSLALATAGRCPGASCSAWAARVGLQATWTFARPRGPAPWAGVASGYEWIGEDRRQGGTVTTRYRGFEVLAVQGGAEWRLWDRVALGPYALLSVGRYARYALDTGLAQTSVAIPDRAIHAWFHVGVRGRLLLGGRS